ncbi:threonine dehydratase [Alkalithermobacter thermoalcaliphilus JW-YL-7 = DSM 7308]|uniref:L-threonine dehydratase catabolic TdcB n=1 Tax=Alkalithermobacter thermoalcaliphilus JW-YL-7 = DSM 7308 TaxID=1121328 RepID=A0A150FR81_CLOPD|nr:threonine dehydratase [[Clostridium] paradoxum JW-YL-7 = DSM 7308]SHL02560.1 threonine dehydratase [[Clostridium] paradoxum JW-YL-7 = DSM 7308]
MTNITLKDIEKAREVLNGVVHKTDLVECGYLSKMSKARVFLKLENLQKTGSFKIRGAYNKIANLSEEEKARGVIASSAGNHAQGVALGAKMNKIKATIVMPSTAPLAKVTATKSYGAEVVLNGTVYDDAYAKACEIQSQTGATFLHPFDDPYVIAGQGTIALEIFEDLDKVDVILVPVGGGGIIAGIAVAAKSINPNVKIIGVEASNAASMKASLDNNEVVTLCSATTIADGIAVKTPGNLTFEIAKKYVDEIVTVSEDEIAQAVLFLMERGKIVAEGSGAVSTAAILSGKVKEEGKNIVAIVSGGNIDVNMVWRIIDNALIKEGRRFSFRTMIEDKPGGLSNLTKLIYDMNANILTVNTIKHSSSFKLGVQGVEIVLETFNKDHIKEIKEKLESNGYIVDACLSLI